MVSAQKERATSKVIGAQVSADDGANAVALWVEEALLRMGNPLADMPPTARRVLDGAMRVVVSQGFGKLTLARISQQSGHNIAAVRYYFGNKAGLVRVMVDAVVYAELLLLKKGRTVANEGGLSQLAQETLILSTPGMPLRVMFQLLPHALKDKELREQLRKYYETFYELHLAQLGAGQASEAAARSRVKGLAMVLAAVADGLTIQALVAPEHFDMVEAVRAFDVLLSHGMPALLKGEAETAK